MTRKSLDVRPVRDKKEIRKIQEKNRRIKRKNRLRLGFFLVLLIFAAIGFVTVIGKLPFFNDNSKKTVEDASYIAKGGDALTEPDATETEVSQDQVREAMKGASSKEGFTDKLQKVLVVKEDADIFTTTDDTSGIAGRVKAGAYVDFYGSEDGWYKIGTNSFEGYGKAELFEEYQEDGVFKVVDGVLIVNKEYSLPSDYDPGFNMEASQSFQLMKADMERDHMNVSLVSDYRNFEEQKNIYERDLEEKGPGYTDSYTAEPGHSEHQLGLAIDVTNDGTNRLNPDFKDSKEADWLKENSYKYGFIIRYPKNKKSQTGYEYEPWHLRYLGPKLAKEIYNSGLTLEEYYGL